MAYTTVNKSEDQFNTILWTGDGTSSRDITGVGFQPDWTWIKQRNGTFSHVLGNALSGDNKFLSSNANQAESTDSTKFRTFVSDGVQVGSHNSVNGNTNTYVSWNWKANGQGSANSDGTITTTYTSANTTSGFSIVSYTGNGTSGATVGHGLGAVPTWILVKRTDTTGSWQLYSAQSGSTAYAILNSQNAFSTATNRWNDTDPTSSVFKGGNSTEVNASGGTYIAYVQANKPGYFQYGLYQGNGNADGRFVYTGGRPSMVLMRPNINSKDWYLWDNKRNGYNASTKGTYPNGTSGDVNLDSYIDILSNGFKVTTTDNSFNGNGNSYNYWVWMQSAVGSNNVPCTAR